jgi:hypothetical protein
MNPKQNDKNNSRYRQRKEPILRYPIASELILDIIIHAPLASTVQRTCPKNVEGRTTAIVMATLRVYIYVMYGW